MVNPGSTLYDEHPDWVVGQPTRRPRRWRHQLVLDVLQPDVSRIRLRCGGPRPGENPGISYLKWDANRPLTDPGSPTLAIDRQANYWVDHARATWRLMETVAERHPEQTLMLCASGGGRVDLGSLRWFHEVWLSDNTDPVDRVRMQWAASHFLPANVVGAHVTREGDRPVAFGCAVAMSARFGFDIDFAGMTDDELAVCRRAVALYRDIRPLVQQGDLWRLVPPDERAALAYVSADGQPGGPLRLPTHRTHERCRHRCALVGSTRTGPTRSPRSISLPALTRPGPSGATTGRSAHGGGPGVGPARALHGPHSGAPVRLSMGESAPFGLVPRGHDFRGSAPSCTGRVRILRVRGPSAVRSARRADLALRGSPSADRLHPLSASGVQFCSTTQQAPAGGDPAGPCLQRLVGG